MTTLPAHEHDSELTDWLTVRSIQVASDITLTSKPKILTNWRDAGPKPLH